MISSVFSVSKQHRGAGSMTGLLQRTAYGRGERRRGREGGRERERERERGREREREENVHESRGVCVRV